MADYLIGIDAGGTKATAAAYTLTGEKLGEEVGGFGNVTVDFAQGLANICETVDRLKKTCDAQGHNCVYLCLGCAGIETGNKKADAKAALQERFGVEICATNDAMLALYSALKGQDGILVIAGTGSIGYSKQGAEIARFGGWGHLINDDGSGYSIAIRAIRFIAYGFDTGNSETPLKKAVFEQLQITELRQLIDFTYNAGKGGVAALVPLVDKLAAKGDPQALEIMEWAGERLAWLVIGLCRRYSLKNPAVVVSGSVLKKSAVVEASFRRTLDGELAEYSIQTDEFEPAKGGYYLWKEQQEG